ncbi:MAG: hypothetical protein F4X40_02720 [Chloroflexi bacterium]|nr:hypothetical protein [Chloroflexota bacterium]
MTVDVANARTIPALDSYGYHAMIPLLTSGNPACAGSPVEYNSRRGGSFPPPRRIDRVFHDFHEVSTSRRHREVLAGEIDMRAVVWLAGIATVMIGTTVYADEFSETRRAVEGHEQFILRCQNQKLGVWNDTKMKEEIEGMGPRQFSDHVLKTIKTFRGFCEGYYEGVNVCTDGGPSLAMDKLQGLLLEVENKLRDPLTPASDYEIYLNIREDYKTEIQAIQDILNNSWVCCDSPCKAGELLTD